MLTWCIIEFERDVVWPRSIGPFRRTSDTSDGGQPWQQGPWGLPAPLCIEMESRRYGDDYCRITSFEKFFLASWSHTHTWHCVVDSNWHVNIIFKALSLSGAYGHTAIGMCLSFLQFLFSVSPSLVHQPAWR